MSQRMTQRISAKISKLLGRAPSVLRPLEGTSSLIAHDERHRCSLSHAKISNFEAILLQNPIFQKIPRIMQQIVSECVKHIQSFSKLNFYVSKHIIDVRNATLVDMSKFEKSHFLA